MRSLRGILLAGSMVFAVATGAHAAEMKAEVIHWWTSAGESASVRVFADKFKAEGGEWVDTAIAGGANARTAGINRIVGGNPPTSMQFNTGKQFDEIVANDFLRSLDDEAKAEKWAAVIPPGIMRAVTRDGQVYAAPINIHGQHWLFYNTKVFKDAGVEPPKTWPELVATGPKFKEKGIIPLALGGQPNWERGLFNSVLAGYGGPELFRAFWGERKEETVKSPEFRKIIELYGSLRELVDPGSPGRNWNNSAALVITGKAAMHVMGDWAKGEFIAAGMTAGVDYGCTLLGEKGVFVMGGDVFVFPKSDNADVKVAQDKLIDIFLDPQTQIDFNKKKGSVPVRTDVDTSSMDECAQKGMQAIQTEGRSVEANELLSPPDFTGAIQDLITQYWNNKSATPESFIDGIVGEIESFG